MRGTQQLGASGSAGATPLWQRPASVVVLLGALTFLVYANSLPNEFVFDDGPLIVNYPKIRSISNIPRILGARGRPAYRPLRTVTLAVDYFLFGPNPVGFRAVNITFHALNAALVFFLFRALLKNPRPALLAAILFAVHPIQTESVAYISGRRDLLFALFYLLGFASYVRYRETDRNRYLFLAGFAYLLSLLSKEMAITLPILCIAYDVVRSIPSAEADKALPPWQAAAEGIRTAIRRHKVLYAVGATCLLLILWYYVYYANPSRQRTMYGGGLGPTLLTGSRIVVHYIKLLIFPITLNADYSYNAFPISSSLADARVIVALMILAGAWWGIYRLLAYDRWAAFGGLWFFITLLPVSQIIPHHEMMAEHYLYLPSAGLFLTAGLLLERSLTQDRRRVAIVAGFALVVASLGVRTVVRNRDWRDSETIWTKTIRTAPGSARAHNNVGEIALRKGRFREAYREFREAIRIEPDNSVNRDNFGVVLLRHGLFDEAEREFSEALRIRPSFVKPQVNLGLVHLNRGQLDEAEREFRKALEFTHVRRKRIGRKFRATILNNLGIVLALKGNRGEAEQQFKDAVRLSPKYAEARANLGKVYLEKGRAQEGVAEITQAIRLRGSDPRFHYLLAQAYYQQGEKELAAVELGKTLSLRADFPEARSLLNRIIREKGSERGTRG